MSQIALVIGHNARSQGAFRVTDKRREYDWNSDLAAAIRDLAPGMYEIFRRPYNLGYTQEVRQTYAAVSAKGFRGSIELHFNGSASPISSGTETLTSGTAGSFRLADLINPAMARALGLRNRGILHRKRGERGAESLWAGTPPAILIEPYFGSNAGDCAAADKHFAALSRAIHEACLAYLKGV